MEEQNKKPFNPAVIPALIFLYGAAVWANALDGPFVFDDWVYAVENPYIRDIKNLFSAGGPRHIAYLSFALNYLIGGVDPFGYHLFNVIVHIINAILVFYIAAALFKTPGANQEDSAKTALPMAIAVSLIFLTHPVQTQAVTYITQRFTSLAALFYLSTVFFYIRFMTSRNGAIEAGKTNPPNPPLEKGGEGGFDLSAQAGRPVMQMEGIFNAAVKKAHVWVFYSFSILSAVLAMKTKETSFTLPFVIALLEVSLFVNPAERGQRPLARRLLYLLPFILTLFIAPLSLIQQADAGGGYNEIEKMMASRKLEEAAGISRWGYLITQSTVIMRYLRLLVWPAGQQFDYDYPLKQSIFEPDVLISSIILLTALILSVYFFVRSLKSGDRLVHITSFGMLWFFITLSIESSIIPIHDAINEHRVYLPSVGIILAFVSLLYLAQSRLRKRLAPRLSPAALAAVIAVLTVPPLSIATFLRNELWRDEVRLYEDETKKNPVEASSHIYLGIAYSSRGRLHEAADEFKAAIAAKPIPVRLILIPARANLARTYLKLGRLDEAIGEFKALSELKPEDASLRVKLAVIYINKGMKKEARDEIDAALKIDPESVDAKKVRKFMLSNKPGKMKIMLR